MRQAKKIPVQIRAEALTRPPGSQLRKKLLDWSDRSESRARLDAMIALAESEAAIVVPLVALDADPLLLNVLNGTLDFRTGELYAHRREDLISKLAPVSYEGGATCPKFDAFLERIQPDAGARTFLQRILGYSLFAGNPEQVISLFIGSGANGKTTLVNVLRRVLGDYAAAADATTLLAGNETVGPRPDLTRLRAVRVLFVSEVGVGRNLDESLVKALTGGDPLVARTHHREPIEFVPHFTPFLAANHTPVIRDTSHGMWRRIRVVPFPVTIPPAEQDFNLVEDLAEQASGILEWLVQGWLASWRDGLGTTDAVGDATAAYREQSDALAGFLAERCVVDPGVSCLVDNLYGAYRSWADAAGEKAASARRFRQWIAERGFHLDRTGRTRFWIGLDLRIADDPGGPTVAGMALTSGGGGRYATPFVPTPNGAAQAPGTPIRTEDLPEIARRLGGG
jgi:putative DNA primase/helicase